MDRENKKSIPSCSSLVFRFLIGIVLLIAAFNVAMNTKLPLGDVIIDGQSIPIMLPGEAGDHIGLVCMNGVPEVLEPAAFESESFKDTIEVFWYKRESAILGADGQIRKPFPGDIEEEMAEFRLDGILVDPMFADLEIRSRNYNTWRETDEMGVERKYTESWIMVDQAEREEIRVIGYQTGDRTFMGEIFIISSDPEYGGAGSAPDDGGIDSDWIQTYAVPIFLLWVSFNLLLGTLFGMADKSVSGGRKFALFTGNLAASFGCVYVISMMKDQAGFFSIGLGISIFFVILVNVIRTKINRRTQSTDDSMEYLEDIEYKEEEEPDLENLGEDDVLIIDMDSEYDKDELIDLNGKP